MTVLDPFGYGYTLRIRPSPNRVMVVYESLHDYW